MVFDFIFLFRYTVKTLYYMHIQNRINVLSLNGKTSQEATKTGLLVWSITFLQEVAFPVSLIKMLSGWLQNYFNIIDTPNTFENRNAIYHNLRIFTIKFSA